MEKIVYITITTETAIILTEFAIFLTEIAKILTELPIFIQKRNTTKFGGVRLLFLV